MNNLGKIKKYLLDIGLPFGYDEKEHGEIIFFELGLYQYVCSRYKESYSLTEYFNNKITTGYVYYSQDEVIKKIEFILKLAGKVK